MIGLNVKNHGVIRRLSFKTLWASRRRNLIAIAAIALTALLFTSLFTIVLSVNEGFQQSNFRQVGGSAHGSFKYLTEEQFQELREDPAIRQWGLRRFIGMPLEAPFHKSHVEISYSDANQSDWMFCAPVQGRLPEEGTQEAATDLKVLELLGVKPELGAPFTVTFDVDGQKTTQTFILCGWWDYDPVIVANHILIPESRVNAILAETGTDPANTADGMIGSWNLDMMLNSSLHIERDLIEILEQHGYEEGYGEGQIAIGVNWGYSGAQLLENLDFVTLLAGAAALLLIILTGYLIIYNIFRISVVEDIRFYGFLKTIGTTPRQLKRMIRYQAMFLSLCGIPLGLLLGWLVGALLTPVVISRLNGVENVTSVSPAIFLIAAAFALVTVLLSCRMPGRMAAKVSPIEAVRYTEARIGRRKPRTSGGTVSLLSMARANLGRSPGKTALTIASLCLAVVLLNLTVTFTGGFDMDKYLKDVPADFIVADASYFQTGKLYSAEDDLPEAFIDQLTVLEGIEQPGRTYGKAFAAQEFVTEEWFRFNYGHWTDEESIDQLIQQAEKTTDGFLADRVQLYGMEAGVLDKLTVLEGDLSQVYEPGSRCIAASYSTDDYGNLTEDSNWAKVGDEVTIRYIEEYEYYNPVTGEVYGPEVNLDTVEVWAERAKLYRDITYTVVALVDVPHALGYRYYGADEFVLNSQTFCQDSGTNNVMYYAFDMETEADVAEMEAYLQDVTENAAQSYESKATYVESFRGYQNMYLMLGGALSFIVGLVGILNFFNTIMTGILSRQREFAVLQAVGMTNRQLKTMLMYEGLLYTLGSAAAALILSIGLNPLVCKLLEKMFWFFSGNVTVVPVLIAIPVFALLGCLIPSVMYSQSTKRSVVDRLKEVG